MPDTAAAPWTLTGTVAATRAAETAARLDLAAPSAGLAVVEAGGTDHLLGIDLRAAAGPPAERWVRGADLTAVYEPTDARRLRATAMWRVHPAAVAAWELVVSAQTSLLHADATLAVVSDIACEDASWGAPAANGGHRWEPLPASAPLPAQAAFVLARRGATAVVVAVHPRDPRRIAVTVARGRARVECGIFPTAIEKGVILRSRVLAAIGPAPNAESWAAALCGAFTDSPPFLDT
ncbi:MAG: hypothetical protein ACKOSQ_11760 [Planctomycetaceae bacterium]